MTRRPASALIALASGMAMEDPADAPALDALLEVVAARQDERAALLSGLARANAPEIARIVADLLDERAVRLREAETARDDRDAVIGVWSQRVVAGGAIVLGGTLVSGTLGAVSALAALGVLGAAGLVVGGGRLANRGARRRTGRLRAQLESLAVSVRDGP